MPKAGWRMSEERKTQRKAGKALAQTMAEAMKQSHYLGRLEPNLEDRFAEPKNFDELVTETRALLQS